MSSAAHFHKSTLRHCFNSAARRNAVVQNDSSSDFHEDEHSPSAFFTDLERDGAKGTNKVQHSFVSSPSRQRSLVQASPRKKHKIVVNVKEMVGKAKKLIAEPLPGGLSLNASENGKYFGPEARQHFFDQYNNVAKNRNIFYVDSKEPLSPQLVHSLKVVQALHSTHSTKPDVNSFDGGNADVSFLPIRQPKDELKQCRIDTRILIRDQSLTFEEGYKQMKIVSKPSYVDLSDEDSDSENEKKSIEEDIAHFPTLSTSPKVVSMQSTHSMSPSKYSDNCDNSTVSSSLGSSSTMRKSTYSLHKVKYRSKGKFSAFASPNIKTVQIVPMETKLKRLPPLHTDMADNVINNINEMYNRVINKGYNQQSVSDSYFEFPLHATVPPLENLNIVFSEDKVNSSRSENSDQETVSSYATSSTLNPALSHPANSSRKSTDYTSFRSNHKGSSNKSLLYQSIRNISKTSSKDVSGWAQTSAQTVNSKGYSPGNIATSQRFAVKNKISSHKAKDMIPIESNIRQDTTVEDLAGLYKEHVKVTDPGRNEANVNESLTKEAKSKKKKEDNENTHNIHKPVVTNHELDFICIEHRDENNKDLMSPVLAKGHHKGKNSLFKYVQSKMVKDFHENSQEISENDAYLYSEIETDLELEMWQEGSGFSPANAKDELKGKDSNDEKEQANSNKGKADKIYEVLSPRSQFIDNCIRQRLNPRAGLLLRKQLTRELNLKHIGMGDEIAVLLSDALVNLPYIEAVDISDNNLTDKGLSAIVHTIVSIPSVRFLNMSFNVIGPEAASALASYLSSPTCSLQSLILQKADVDDDECRNFVDALHHNRSLLTLDLSENKVGISENLNTVMPDLVTGGEALAELLRSDHCTLQTLKLGWNLIRLGGADELCNSLAMNKSITYLDLSFNSLGSTGGMALGDALQDNSTLRTLYVANNSLDSMACVTICAGILQNQNLEYVNFDGNPIAQQGAKALMLLPTIVGSRVGISAKGCNISLSDSKNWFDTGMITRPYELDLSSSFERAIALILTYLIPSHQTYIVARSEYLDTEKSNSNWININLQEAIVEDIRKIEPEQMKEIEGLNRIREATKDIRKAVALFQEVDKDGSGELDEEEFGHLMEILGMDFAEQKVKEVMAEYDVDGGGIIEVHEFLLFLRNQQKEAGKRLKELTEYPILISGLQYNLPPPTLHVVNVPQDHTPGQTNNASMATMNTSSLANMSIKVNNSGNNMHHSTAKSLDNINKPNYIKYTPPRHGILKINVVDGFTQKESFRVISPEERSNILLIAQQSGDVLQMTSFGVQNYKIRYNEGLGFVQSMSKENTNKISILKTILPRMSTPVDARQLVNKVLNANKMDINRLKREIGQAYKVIMGQPDGYYNLDLSNEMDRFCINCLLELSMTRAHLRSVKFSTLGYGKLGDTSQKGNWSCFRNELFNKRPAVMSIDFASPLPKAGRLEFDFVSLNRVNSDTFVLNDLRFTNLLVKSYFLRVSDRSKALSMLKNIHHQCEKTVHGDAKTIYETPKDKALETGQHQSRFYDNLRDRYDQYERYKARENVKVSWEYDPDIIQLNLSNLKEIYTIPTIFAPPDVETKSSTRQSIGESRLAKTVRRASIVSTMSKPSGTSSIGSVAEKAASVVNSIATNSRSTSQPTDMPTINNDGNMELQSEDDNELDESDWDSDNSDDGECIYIVDSKEYANKTGSMKEIDISPAANNISNSNAAISGNQSSSVNGTSGNAKNPRMSLLSSMAQSNNRTTRSQSVIPEPISTSASSSTPAHQYHPSLLRVSNSSSNLEKTEVGQAGKIEGVYEAAEAVIEKTIHVKSLAPDKKPFSEQFNRLICLLASKNVPPYAKAAKLLELFLDMFEYAFLYARHLEMIMILFESYGSLRVSDHFGTYRVELFVQLFSNIVDIHNMEIVMRRLSAYEVGCVIARIGILNLFNPMKPEGSIECDLSRRDDRIVVKMLAQLSVVEPGDNLSYVAFQWDRSMDYMPGYELTELWMTEDGMPNKGIWSCTYYAGEGVNKKGCKPVVKFRKALLQLVLITEEEVQPEKMKDDVLPPLVGPSVIHNNPLVWCGYLAYNEDDFKEMKEKKGKAESSGAKGRKK